jgi:phage terminase large subunit
MAVLNYTFAPKYKDFIKDFMNSEHLVYSLYGGRNSAKSTTLYMLELAIVMSEGCVMVVRKHMSSIEESSFNGICKVIEKYNLNKYFKITKRPMRITCLKTG